MIHNQLIKSTKRLGNGTGVLLPKEWKNSLVKVEIVEQYNDMDLLSLLKQEINLKEIFI